jgi:UDP-apiose/xylose synthase
MNFQTLCILGCGGFIGSHLLDRLLSDNGYRVIGIDTASTKIKRHLDNPALSFVRLDIGNTAQVHGYIEQSDVVISLAALCIPSLYNTVPLRVIDNNFIHPYTIAAMCSESKKWLIHFSTCEVYGRTAASYSANTAENNAIPFSEETSPFVLGPVSAQRWTYACAKQLVERAIIAYHSEKGLDYTIVRPFNFIGPRMDFIPGIDGEGIPRVVASFMEALFKGNPLKLVDGGKNRRSFTYIDDAIDAVMAIIRNPDKAKGQVFNIGNPDNETTIEGLALRMKRLYEALVAPQRAIEIVEVASEEFYGKGYEDCDRRIPDITKARTILGWEPKTSLEEALAKTMKGFINDYRGKDLTSFPPSPFPLSLLRPLGVPEGVRGGRGCPKGGG